VPLEGLLSTRFRRGQAPFPTPAVPCCPAPEWQILSAAATGALATNLSYNRGWYSGGAPSA
jgi:hypothetical protein